MESITTINENQFIDFFNQKSYSANCFNEDGSLNKNYNSLKVTGTIAKIFEDHWESTYLLNKSVIDEFRPNASVEVQKIIDCYNKDLGCSLYECPSCHEIAFISHTCKSRFCSSCGYKYKNQRVESILQTAYNCNHRQIVFTIPEQLRSYFFHPFERRINILFKAVRDTIYSILNESFKKNKKGVMKKYKSRVKYTPGYFAFLHTFGRDLKWNPHIHILIAELKLGDNGSCIPWEYFDYNALSFRFQLSGKTVDYICPKCKYKFDAPIEAVLEFEQEDEWNGLPISTPPYTICTKCNFDKCVPIDYHSSRGYHHIYKEN